MPPYHDLKMYSNLLNRDPRLKEQVLDELSDFLEKKPHRPQIYTNKSTGCWHFRGGGSVMGGYQYFKFTGARVRLNVAHVLHMLYTETAPPDDDREYSHRCNHSLCIKPGHLVLETHAENLARKQCKIARKCICGEGRAPKGNNPCIFSNIASGKCN